METAPIQNQPSLNQNQKKPSSSNLIYLVIFVILIIVILAFAFFLFQKNQPKKAATTPLQTATPSAQKQNNPASSVGYVNAQSGLNLRDSASADANVILILPYGTEVNIISTDGDWDFVEANTKGFVSKEFISSSKPSGATILKTFKDSAAPFTFLYPDVYQLTFTNPSGTLSFSFTGNDSFGGFSVQSASPFTTIGNYALTNYNTPGAACDIKFSARSKECEKVVTTNGTLYLVLAGNTLYKFSYLKTEGGLLTDLNNLVFSSLVFGGS